MIPEKRVKISVVVASLGPRVGCCNLTPGWEQRINKTIRSLMGQDLDHLDQVIVAMNGYQGYAATAFRQSGLSGVSITAKNVYHRGEVIRAGLCRAGGDFVVVCRDGDEWERDAVKYMREQVSELADTYLFGNSLSHRDGPHAMTALCPNPQVRTHNGNFRRFPDCVVLYNYVEEIPDGTDSLHAGDPGEPRHGGNPVRLGYARRV